MWLHVRSHRPYTPKPVHDSKFTGRNTLVFLMRQAGLREPEPHHHFRKAGAGSPFFCLGRRRAKRPLTDHACLPFGVAQAPATTFHPDASAGPPDLEYAAATWSDKVGAASRHGVLARHPLKEGSHPGQLAANVVADRSGP